MSNIPIFIPSKNRYEKNDTLKLLEPRAEDAANYVILVVEPQDEPLYRANFPWVKHYIVLPSSNQGIAYVRQYILQYTRDKNIDWYWMLDDDISGCGSFHIMDEEIGKRGLRVNKRNGELREYTLSLYDELKIAEEEFLKVENLGQGSFEYRPISYFASRKPSYETKNSYCDVAVLINSKAISDKGVNYRRRLRLKEDRDFTAQILSVGLKTIRKTSVFFSVPRNGSNSGGLSTEYAVDGREIEANHMVVDIWGKDLAKVEEKYTREQLATATTKAKLKEEGYSEEEAARIATEKFKEKDKELRRVDVKLSWRKIAQLNWTESPAKNELESYDFYKRVGESNV